MILQIALPFFHNTGRERHLDVRIPQNMHLVNLINSEMPGSQNKHDDDNNNNLEAFLDANKRRVSAPKVFFVL